MKDARDFFLDDFFKALFPLDTNRFLIDTGAAQIENYLTKVLDSKDATHSFLAQTRVYAAKPKLHLRRTVKLDAVAEYFLYDLVYRNRQKFQKPHSTTHRHFGYRFANGVPISPTDSYRGYKGAISAAQKKYKHSISFDIASYFNSVYHHDLVSWMANIGASDDDYNAFGQYLREINAGRSIDCLPQGIYPAKMIGNDFLRFIDNHHALKSTELVRFMDDVILFSDNEEIVKRDFLYLQRLLGEKGLSVNPHKTQRDAHSAVTLQTEIDDIKQKLLQRRRYMITVGYDDDNNAITKQMIFKKKLNAEELSYLTALLNQDTLDEDDAELILTLMREHEALVHKRLVDIVIQFPHLMKSVYNFCAHVKNTDFLSEMVRDVIKTRVDLQEFQIFWFAWILHSYLMDTRLASQLIEMLFNHPSATAVCKAKILEIPDLRYGLTELRDGYLGAGQSDWLAWSSAVGHRTLKPISRNHKLTYFGKSSHMNHLIREIVAAAP